MTPPPPPPPPPPPARADWPLARFRVPARSLPAPKFNLVQLEGWERTPASGDAIGASTPGYLSIDATSAAGTPHQCEDTLASLRWGRNGAGRARVLRGVWAATHGRRRTGGGATAAAGEAAMAGGGGVQGGWPVDGYGGRTEGWVKLESEMGMIMDGVVMFIL